MPVLALGVASGVSAAIILAWPLCDALGRLAGAWAEREALHSAIAAPVTPLVAPTLAIAGSATVERLIRVQAARDGVLVESVRQAPRNGRLARVELAVSGSSEAVLHFADALERGRPMIRFSRWRIAPSGTAVRLDGEAIAPWR